MNFNRRRFVVALLVLSMVSIWQPQMAKASINGNEASVIAAASSTFYYNGQYYVADSGYMAQLQAKLNEDDVDLTTADAQSAINRIYSSVAEGVEKGYVVPVGGTAETPTATPAPSKDTTNTPSRDNSGSIGSDKQGNSGSGNEGGSAGDTPADSNAVNGSGSGDGSSGADAAATIPDGVVIANADGTYTIQGQNPTETPVSAADEADEVDRLQNEDEQEIAAAAVTPPTEASSGLYLDETTGELYISSSDEGEDGFASLLGHPDHAQSLSDKLGHWLNLVTGAVLVMVAVMLALFVISTVLGCGKLQRKGRSRRHREGHKRRKGLRRAVGILGIVITSISMVIFTYGAAYLISGYIEGDSRVVEEAVANRENPEIYEVMQQAFRGYGSQYMVRMMLYGLLTFVMSLFLVFIVQYFWHRGVRMIRYGLISGGFTVLAITGIFYITGIFTNVSMESATLYSYYYGYIQNGLLLAIVFSGILIMVSVLLYPLERYLRKQAIHQ